MPVSRDIVHIAADPKALEKQALDILRHKDNPFSETVVRTPDDPLCVTYDVRGILAEQRRALLRLIDGYRCWPPRSTQVFPVIGEAGSGKTHLLGWLKRTLEPTEYADSKGYFLHIAQNFKSAGHIFIVSEGFPTEQDVFGFLLRQVSEQLLSTPDCGPKTLDILSRRVCARMLTDCLRKLDPAARLNLVQPTNAWDRLGRQFGFASSVDRVGAIVEDALVALDAEPAPSIPKICWNAGFDLAGINDMILRHVEESADFTPEGLLRKQILEALIRVAFFDDHNDLKQLLARLAGFDFEGLPGSTPPAKCTLKVLFELLAPLRVPVVVAFDQIEDLLSASSSEKRHELLGHFCHGLVRLIHAVPGLCIFLFLERGLWSELTGEQSKYVVDRLYKPGETAENEIKLQARLTRDQLIALISQRVRPLLADLPNQERLTAIFPFKEEHIEKVLGETTVRGCLQQMSKMYTKLTSVPGKDELLKRLTRHWNKLQQGLLQAHPNGFRGDSIPQAHEALDFVLNDLLQSRWLEGTDWSGCEVWRDENETYGWLIVLTYSEDRSDSIGVGIWLGWGNAKAKDLQSRINMFQASPLRTLLLFHRDGSAAAESGMSETVLGKAKTTGLDVRIEQMAPEDLAKVLSFQSWLELIGEDEELDADKRMQVIREIIGGEFQFVLNALERARATNVKAEA